MELPQLEPLALAVEVGGEDGELSGELVEGLAAHAARKRGGGAIGHHREGDELATTLGHGPGHRRALGTDTKAERAVLHVASGEDPAVAGLQGGTHLETAVRGVGLQPRLLGFLVELVPIHRRTVARRPLRRRRRRGPPTVIPCAFVVSETIQHHPISQTRDPRYIRGCG